MPDEYISREAAIDEIDKWLDSVGTALVGKGLSYYGELIGCIEDAPKADVAPVKYGKWAVHYTAAGNPYTECTHCCTDFTFKTDKGTFAKLDMRGMPYCPHCGARMDGGYER